MFELCHHVMPSGARCQSPALAGNPLCYFHSRQRRIVAQNRDRTVSILLPLVEDASSLLLATNELLAALADSRIKPEIAAILLRGLDLARKTIRSKQAPAATDAVTQLATTQSGEVLAADAAPDPAADAGDASPAAFPDAPLDARECLLTPVRDDAYFMGMYKAQQAHSKMRQALMHFEPDRKLEDPLPGDPDGTSWQAWDRRQEELKRIREQREEFR